MNIEQAKGWASESAKRLEVAGLTILLVSIFATLVLLFIGFMPVCAPEDVGSYWCDEGLYNLPTFGAAALVQQLIAWVVWVSLGAFSSSLRLQVALARIPALAETSGSSSRPNQNGLPPVKLTAAQRRLWRGYGEPDLSGWKEGSFEDWVRTHG